MTLELSDLQHPNLPITEAEAIYVVDLFNQAAARLFDENECQARLIAYLGHEKQEELHQFIVDRINDQNVGLIYNYARERADVAIDDASRAAYEDIMRFIDDEELLV